MFNVGVLKKPSPMITFLHTCGNARVGWVLCDTVWRREGERNPQQAASGSGIATPHGRGVLDSLDGARAARY